jgi:hypothetical protein
VVAVVVLFGTTVERNEGSGWSLVVGSGGGTSGDSKKRRVTGIGADHVNDDTFTGRGEAHAPM